LITPDPLAGHSSLDAFLPGLALFLVLAVGSVPVWGVADGALYRRGSAKAASRLSGGHEASLAAAVEARLEGSAENVNALLRHLDSADLRYEARWIESTPRRALLRVSLDFPWTGTDGTIDIAFVRGEIVQVDDSGYLAPSGGTGADSAQVDSHAGAGAWRQIEAN
jgi:hypothetical protein